MITIVAATKPGIVNAPTTEIEGVNAKIIWTSPTTGGSTITGYRV